MEENTLPQTHDTIIVAKKGKKTVFFKSYHYDSQKEEVNETLENIKKLGLSYKICDISLLEKVIDKL